MLRLSQLEIGENDQITTIKDWWKCTGNHN